MGRMISPSKKTLEVFKRDLWKDQRRLETVTLRGHECLVKHYVTEQEAHHEKSVLSHLASSLSNAKVPQVLDEGDMYVVLPYLQGVRVFNLFAELDRLQPPLDVVGREIKAEILSRCEDNQKEIQQSLMMWGNGHMLDPYPQHKISSIIQLLADCLGIEMDKEHLSDEISQLSDILSKGSSVPFRDASTKNMVLASSKLWLGYFTGEDERRKFLHDSIMSGEYREWVEQPIYDFDFASCINTTTPEDDVVSLRYQERTWSGMPVSAKELVWWGESDARRAAVTFFVRYYRFGGRKAAYRLLHPSGHRIRFRHDNDVFYFERAPSVMTHLWPEASNVFPRLLEFTSIVAKYLQAPVSSFDYFRSQQNKSLQKRRYYVDMFPE